MIQKELFGSYFNLNFTLSDIQEFGKIFLKP